MNEQLSPPAEGAAPSDPDTRGDSRGHAVNNSRRNIAPCLAGTLVLLAAIGLSHEMLMAGSPTVYLSPVRQQVATGLLQGADSGAAIDSFDDGTLQHAVTEDARQFVEKKAGQTGHERELLQATGSRADHDLPVDADLSLAAPMAVPETRQRREHEYMAKNLPAPRPVLESPAEESREKFARKEVRPKYPQSASSPSMSLERDAVVRTAEVGGGTTGLRDSEISRFELAGSTGSVTHAGFDFLDRYRQTHGLQFRQATGYWANRYIPGDPEIRMLGARLAKWDRSWLENNATLEQDVEPFEQPFDAPLDNALALSLMTDSNSVPAIEDTGEPARMRLQIGIQGIEHRRGQRPAMTVAVVVDLPTDAPDEVRIATRALLDAMLKSKQAGDHFSLVMTGRNSLVIPSRDFRFGSLQLARQKILAQNMAVLDDHQGSTSLNLYQAIQRAGAMVKQTDEPGRPLGSSSLLLISASTLPDIGQLSALAHEQARQGITLSVVPLGKRPANSNVEKLVLAGLGNRRFLETPGGARQLVEEELHASSRAVARAARLSIRLAPGVRLIDVVGSKRLDTLRVQRLHEIENSMDHRLSANLGIKTDRGADEDGIQMVIPSIYSGDSITVLLDIAVERPGAIAEVSLRYKDLVFLRNGSLSGQMELPAGDSSGPGPNPGPAQLVVLKNLLSYHVVEAVKQAAAALGRRRPDESAAILRRMNASIDQARQALPAWVNDKDLINDQQLLDRYIAALDASRTGAHQSFLAESLRYAAWAKTHRPLQEWKQ